MTMWIVYPWAATRLWNSRWNAMSFGPLEFRANLDAVGLKGRCALTVLAPWRLGIVGAVVAALSGLGSSGVAPRATVSAVVVGLVVLIYLAIPLMTLNWYAKYFRHAAAATKLGDLECGFDATTLQWLGLFLG